MITIHRIFNFAACVGICLALAPITALSQNYSYVGTPDLKESPHLFWAKGIVFRDVLEESPHKKTKKIDDRTYYRLKVSMLGDVYAEEETLPKFEGLQLEQDYYFSGTIAQRGRSYFYIVNNVSSYTNDAEYLKALIAQLNDDSPTNQYNQVFMVVEEIIQDIHNDLFGYSTEEGVPINELIGDPKYRQIVSSAARTALRRFENVSKGTSQELLISVVVSMMALQYGYADVSDPGSYEPGMPEEGIEEAVGSDVTAESAEYNGLSEAEWDLSEDMVASALDVEVVSPEEAVETEEVAEATEAVAESVEAVAEPAAVDAPAEEEVIEDSAPAEDYVPEQIEEPVQEDLSRVEEVAEPAEVVEEVPEVEPEEDASSMENPEAVTETQIELTEEMVLSALGMEVQETDTADAPKIENESEPSPESVVEVTEEAPAAEAVAEPEVEMPSEQAELSGVTEETGIESSPAEEEVVEGADSAPEEKEPQLQEKIDYSSPLRIR